MYDMSEAHEHEPPSVPFEDLPTRLKLARWKAGLEQEQMANRLGMHRRTVANYEGGNTDPKLPLLMAWAQITNVPVDWLTFGTHHCPHCGGNLVPEASDRRTCFSLSDLASDVDAPAETPKRPELVLIKS